MEDKYGTEKKRKVVDEDEDVPPGWKPTWKGKAVASPSVAMNKRNLKMNFPSMFLSPKRS